jgi:2-(1,2-epoxy-1,2-dihydrophenyl)acetyl-CoA isomerase
MPEQGLVLLTTEQGIARVTLNRPDHLNALDNDLALELANTFEGLERDPAPRVVTLMGSGRAFMAGGDIAVFKAPAIMNPRSSAG